MGNSFGVTGENMIEAIRRIYILLSCPGDMHEEKDMVDAAIQNMASIFRRYDIEIVPWRHERDVVPDVGDDAQDVVNKALPTDYDIYVGLMCGRFGTPTARAGSGTVEEFEDARRRFQQAGRPYILFYLCSDPQISSDPAHILQFEQVNIFRQQYPGIFSSFRSGSDLVMQLQRHLTDRILRLCFPAPGSNSASTPRTWVPAIATEIDRLESLSKCGYLDYSSQKPARILKKLDTLFDLNGLLTALEQETLAAAAYVCVLRFAENRASEPPCPLERFLPFGPKQLAEVEVVSEHGERQSTQTRPELLAGLLQLGRILDLDRAGISHPASLGPPTGRKLSYWLAFLTAEIRVTQRGVVLFRLLGSTGQWADPLRRMAALRVEGVWERLRHLFLKNGVVFAVGPGQVLITDETGESPQSILKRLDKTGVWLQEHLPKVKHWGESLTDATYQDIWTLVPLPQSSMSASLEFSEGREFFRRLTMTPPFGPDIAIDADEGTSLILESRMLEPGVIYSWSVTRDYGTGELSEVGRGELRALSERDQVLWEIRAASGDLAERRNTQIELQLWNDLLQDLWSQLIEQEAQYEDWLLTRRILHSAFEYARRVAPGSTQVDLYRKATEWADLHIDRRVHLEKIS